MVGKPNEETEKLAKKVLAVIKAAGRPLKYAELEAATGVPKGRSMDLALKLLRRKKQAVFVRGENGPGWVPTSTGKKA